MSNASPNIAPANAPPERGGRDAAGVTIRAREPSDWPAVGALMQLPKVRWGTLRLPYESLDQWRKFTENPPDGMIAIVAVLDGHIVGTAGLTRQKGRRSHVGDIGVCVHDDFHGRRIGSALVAALVEAADNWLNLRRLELTVYVDNEPAIRLYKRFGFEVEGTRRGDAFRDGAYADSYAMARFRDG